MNPGVDTETKFISIRSTKSYKRYSQAHGHVMIRAIFPHTPIAIMMNRAQVFQIVVANVLRGNVPRDFALSISYGSHSARASAPMKIIYDIVYANFEDADKARDAFDYILNVKTVEEFDQKFAHVVETIQSK